MSNQNYNNNGYPPNGIPPGWVFYPYQPPAVVVYPHHQIPQASQEISLPAPAAQSALSIAPPPPPEPARLNCPPSEASPKPNEHNQLALPAQIKFVACHHCATCGRPRSHAYHKEHPLIPGQVAPASTCRKCLKKQDKGEPIDSIMLSIRSHVSHKDSTRSGQFYNPPSTEPPRGRVRSVSWRHVAPRGISRPRIESLDGFTNDTSEAPPPPAPSVPLSRASSARRPLKERVSRPPSDKLSRTASSAGSRADARRNETNYRVRFEHSPSQERHGSLKREQQDLTPYFRHVTKRDTEVAPREVESTYHAYKRREEFEEEEEVDTRLRLARPATSFNRFILGLFPSRPTGS